MIHLFQTINMKKLSVYLLLSFWLLHPLLAQHEDQTYYPVEDSLVREKLEEWQDMKFGLLMHWGAYSQWGIVESWSICPEDYGWCQRKKQGTPGTYFEYVQAYENLQTTFNPTQFGPEKWAQAAKEAGMKYLVFTTKHHDGFCMFDSKYTDYKITGEKTPFSSHPRANVTKEIFDAFRAQGLWAGAYFSKPDWHSDDYWWPYFPPKDRNVNYDPEVYPERWERFVEYTHNQILELLTDYGKVDILWLDGGWVRKKSKEDMQAYYARQLAGLQTGFQKTSVVNQDIRMDELVEKARQKQPGLIVVDRAVEGKNQNYLTPENRVPEQALPYPWESCIIAGGGWSYTPNAQYMSGREAIHLLIEIVCKGGNLLYNIAPGPDGTWHEDAYDLLAEMGDWIDINGEAIYATRAIPPYATGKISYTRKKDSDIMYAIYRADEGETEMPARIQIDDFAPLPNSSVYLLGHEDPLKWEMNGTGFSIEIPRKWQKKPPSNFAWAFKFQMTKK